MAEDPIDLTLESDTEPEDEEGNPEPDERVIIDLCESDEDAEDDEAREDSADLPPQNARGAAEPSDEAPAQASTAGSSGDEEPSARLNANEDDASATSTPPASVPPISAFAARSAPAGVPFSTAQAGECAATEAAAPRASDAGSHKDAGDEGEPPALHSPQVGVSTPASVVRRLKTARKMTGAPFPGGGGPLAFSIRERSPGGEAAAQSPGEKLSWGGHADAGGGSGVEAGGPAATHRQAADGATAAAAQLSRKPSKGTKRGRRSGSDSNSSDDETYVPEKDVRIRAVKSRMGAGDKRLSRAAKMAANQAMRGEGFETEEDLFLQDCCEGITSAEQRLHDWVAHYRAQALVREDSVVAAKLARTREDGITVVRELVDGKTRQLPQDPNVFLNRRLDEFGRDDLKGLERYSLHCLLNGQPIDVAPCAQLVSDYQRASSARPATARAVGYGSKRVLTPGRGIDVKGSLLHLLFNSGRGCQYMMYVGSHKLQAMKGFGVRALEFIPAGTWILIYTGDWVFGEEEVERREDAAREMFGRVCYTFHTNDPQVAHTYMLDAAGNAVIIPDEHLSNVAPEVANKAPDEPSPVPNKAPRMWRFVKELTVDATKNGNVARWINHSCEPNIQSFDIRLAHAPPVVALATLKDIVVGEELSMDYNQNHKDEEYFSDHLKNSSKVPCLCGAESCRGWVF